MTGILIRFSIVFFAVLSLWSLGRHDDRITNEMKTFITSHPKAAHWIFGSLVIAACLAFVFVVGFVFYSIVYWIITGRTSP